MSLNVAKAALAILVRREGLEVNQKGDVPYRRYVSCQFDLMEKDVLRLEDVPLLVIRLLDEARAKNRATVEAFDYDATGKEMVCGPSSLSLSGVHGLAFFLVSEVR